ncbi:hypothetical protein NMY22_g16101 [Coprinellus aureogranulatus]|nr:hypothetical protein NMY22_g16101 [Coprinellus aureogranulatus]
MSVKQVMSTAANVLEIAGSASGLPYAAAAGQILSAIIDVCDNVRVNKKKARAIRDKCVRIQGVLVEEEANLDGTDVLESIHETLNTLDSIKNRMSRVARAKSWEIWKNGEWEKTLDRCEEDLEWAQSKFNVNLVASMISSRCSHPADRTQLTMVTSQRDLNVKADKTLDAVGQLRELISTFVNTRQTSLSSELENSLGMVENNGSNDFEQLMEAGQQDPVQ